MPPQGITMSQRQPGPNELRDHLANERTFLAWMRTAITIIGLGFVVAKFGLLLREVGGNHVHHLTAAAGAAIGVAMVVGGITSALLATLKFLQIRHDIERDIVSFSPALDLILAAVIVIAGLIMGIYMVTTA